VTSRRMLPLEQRYRRALEKAAAILAGSGVTDPLDAYWLLVKREKELGYPVTYDFVLEALRLAEMHKRGVAAAEVADTA